MNFFEIWIWRGFQWITQSFENCLFSFLGRLINKLKVCELLFDDEVGADGYGKQNDEGAAAADGWPVDSNQIVEAHHKSCFLC